MRPVGCGLPVFFCLSGSIYWEFVLLVGMVRWICLLVAVVGAVAQAQVSEIELTLYREWGTTTLKTEKVEFTAVVQGATLPQSLELCSVDPAGEMLAVVGVMQKGMKAGQYVLKLDLPTNLVGVMHFVARAEGVKSFVRPFRVEVGPADSKDGMVWTWMLESATITSWYTEDPEEKGFKFLRGKTANGPWVVLSEEHYKRWSPGKVERIDSDAAAAKFDRYYMYEIFDGKRRLKRRTAPVFVPAYLPERPLGLTPGATRSYGLQAGKRYGAQKLVFTGTRPVLAAVEYLERTYGVPIQYEEPPLSTAGTLRFSQASLSIRRGNTGDVARALADLLRDYKGTGFTIETQAGSLRLALSTRVMNVTVNFAAEERSAAETIELILREVSRQRDVKVQLADGPVQALTQTRMKLGAQQRQAHLVLQDVLDELSRQAGPLARGKALYCYRLLYAPTLHSYLLRINAVQLNPTL